MRAFSKRQVSETLQKTRGLDVDLEGGRGSDHPDCSPEVQVAVWAQGCYLLVVILKGRNVQSWLLTPRKPSSVIRPALPATPGGCSGDPELCVPLSVHRRGGTHTEFCLKRSTS